jgi:hypothetical protein
MANGGNVNNIIYSCLLTCILNPRYLQITLVNAGRTALKKKTKQKKTTTKKKQQKKTPIK